MRIHLWSVMLLLLACMNLTTCRPLQVLENPVASQAAASMYSRQNALTSHDVISDSQSTSFDTVDGLIANIPSDAQFFYTQGLEFANQGASYWAIQDFSQAIQLDPDFTQAYFQRGNIYLLVGDLNHAIQDFDMVIQLAPDNAEAYSARGIAYLQKQNWSFAIRDLDYAIEIDHGSATAYFARGLTYASIGEHEKAVADFNVSIQLDPENTLIYLWRGITYINMGETEKAVADMLRVLDLCGDYANLCQQAQQQLEKIQDR